MYGRPGESVKNIKGVGQPHLKYLKQIDLKLVATMGKGERVAEARVDDGHELIGVRSTLIY